MANGHAEPTGYTQPSPPAAKWEIPTLEVIEPAGTVLPGNIVKQGETFSLKVTFAGSGPGFLAYTNLEAPFKVRMSIEGLGEAEEADLPAVTGKLVPGQLQYEMVVPVPQPIIDKLDAESVYLVGCVITFSPTIPGMSGFIEHVPFHVYV